MRTEKRQRTALELTTSHALAAMPSRNTGKQCPHLIGCTGALELMKNFVLADVDFESSCKQASERRLSIASVRHSIFFT